MASVDVTNNPNDPNNPNNQPGNVNQPGTQGANQPATTGGGAGPVTATGAGNVTGQVVGTANPAQPFQNISSYLAANAPQSQQLAGAVASTVSQPITQAQTDITNAANTFTGAVNAGYTPENKDLISAVSQNPAFVVNENPQNIQNFLTQLKDTYTGPTDFTQAPNFANLETEIANAQGQAANTQTPAGVQTLLNAVEGPTTAGINNLDALLLNMNPANLATIQAAGAPAAGLTPTLNSTTAAENAAATAGQTGASTSAADAAKALQDALNAESGNLSGQQNTIQGIVNEYNQSVGIINPVTQAIASDIQNFLSANPNLTLNNATDVLAPLTNLQSIAMPGEATYASPYDYQTIAALAKLGLSPDQLANLPITSATANEAQTFQVPEALQNAVGQAPGVESALSNEFNTLGGEINTAVAPYEAAQKAADTNRQNFAAITGNPNIYLTPTMNKATLTDPATGAQVPYGSPQWAALAQQADQYSAAAQQADQDKIGAAKNLGWVQGTSNQYNDLIAAVNAQLGQLGNVGVPTLNYAPTTLTDPVTGAPIGQVAGKEIPGAVGVGTGTLTGVGALIPAATGESAEAAAELAATNQALAGSNAAAIPTATALPAAQAIPAAAIAAYGASNIARNVLAGTNPVTAEQENPIKAGTMDLANTTLSLATLSLPPQVFQSIGKDINGVINSIGDFFGGLF